jgi:hypothetical protein
MHGFKFFFIFISFPLLGQISPEKLINGTVDKGKWQKVEQNIRKSLAKDSLNPEAHYLLSLYYLSSVNPESSVDSAYRYSKSSWKAFRLASPHDREKLRRIPLDSLLLTRLSSRIDSVTFERAKHFNSVAAYQSFIDFHPTAPQVASAVELRDEVAFLEALKINTWNSFRKFMTKYPSSHRRGEAQQRYDKLLFEDKTRDQRLKSYIRFAQEFPGSPYYPQTVRTIFELSTATGTTGSFRWFIDNYPFSHWAKVSKNILYKIQASDEENIFDASWLTDSMKRVEQLNKSYWVPVFKSGLYGFISEDGTEVIPPKFEKIMEDYRCGGITDRLLVTSAGLMARNGAILRSGQVSDAKELGLGYWLVTTDSGNYVMHESGFQMGSSVKGGQLIANHFVGLQKGGKWAVYSLAGKELVPFIFDDISVNDSLIVLSKGSRKILTTPDRLGAVTEKTGFREELVFDDVRRWGRQQYWVRNGVLEGVIDADLHFVIPLDRQVLRKTSFGFLRGKEDKFYINGIRRLENTPYKSVHEQAGWVRLLTPEGQYEMYDRGFDLLTEGDSVWFQGQLAFVQTDDSVRAFLPSGQKLSFLKRSGFQFRQYRDSSAWLVLEDKKKKSVYDAESGVKLFTLEFDQIEPVAHGLFLITRMNKKGLVGEDGKVILPAEYDAIVATDEHSFSLLKEKKFGWFDAGKKILIKPTFDRNIKSYNDRLRTAFREKGYGFLLPDGKPLGNFEWEEIQYWNDSVAWVKKNFQWKLVEINTQKVRLDRIRSFSIVKDTPAEKIFTVRQDNAFGVISNRAGTVVPLQYSDVVNIGTQEVPLYFTERHIEEAGISVVVYYDHRGKIIRKQAMEAEEFEKIYCDN